MVRFFLPNRLNIAILLVIDHRTTEIGARACLGIFEFLSKLFAAWMLMCFYTVDLFFYYRLRSRARWKFRIEERRYGVVPI